MELKPAVYLLSPKAINEAEAVEEAQFCMDLLQDYSITYPIVFDWEPYDRQPVQFLARKDSPTRC